MNCDLIIHIDNGDFFVKNKTKNSLCVAFQYHLQ